MAKEITIKYDENVVTNVELPDRSNLKIGASCCGCNADVTSPKNLFAVSYGTCVIMSMGISAKKSGCDIAGARIIVNLEKRCRQLPDSQLLAPRSENNLDLQCFLT